MFYYRLRGEYYYFLGRPQVFNNLPCYIPSEYVGLYERYGYSYVKDIVNYDGLTDHLYEKELR